MVDAENKVTIHAVKLGPLFGDMWVIESGLQPQETKSLSMACSACAMA